ncbi:unnamed protein product [Alopecurus aequalis]
MKKTVLDAAKWMVGKALASVADGVLEAWDASKNFGLNIEALRTELLLVQATLEAASRKDIGGKAMEELLRKLRHSAHSAEDLLDELDYFRIHDGLHGTCDAADQHAEGRVHDLALHARHTANDLALHARHTTNDVLGLFSADATLDEPAQVKRQRVGWFSWSRARERSHGNSSSSTSNSNQADEEMVMPKPGKLLPSSSSAHIRDDNPHREHMEEVPILGFNRADFCQRIKLIVEQLQPVRRDCTKILQTLDRITLPDIAQSRPITIGRSIEPKLYGRDDIMNSIIHDMTKGKYHRKDLTVLPIVGPGGIGKTTLIQHIYRNEQVKNNFEVTVWVCVSLSFNLNKLIEEIKTNIPQVEGEKDGRADDLIEQRLKFKRFFIVLDDIWEFSDVDDWKRLLLPLRTSQEKGSIIILTTRFPSIAKMVKTTDHIELEGLEPKEFRKLFLAYAFADEPFRSDHKFLLETGDKIMEKLKGSPLAAKTVGTLLRKDLSFRHWRRVLESKEWEGQTGANDIMPALKLSYDYLPFHQQQCFSYSALFPEDYEYSTTELINLWIGLDILQPGGPDQTLEEIGLSNLNDLVTHGLFREEKTDGRLHYVMHDLLHDLALKVASHECLTVHHSNVGSIAYHPSVRHLSIIIDDDKVTHENFKSQLRKLETKLKVKQLHTLMLFGEMDQSFASILEDLFREANALRFLHLVNLPSSVESMLHNFSTLFHLRYLCLGTKYGREMHLPLSISRFYHLRILDLGSWYRCRNFPKDLSNLTKLHRFYTPSDELHSEIFNVGKLVLLEELKVFRVYKESEGFEPKQLERLNELRELGIYNLENIHTKEEADKAKLTEKNNLNRLTLDWDSKRSNIEPDVEAIILESLQPNRYLIELCIRGHGGSSCPTWLGDNLSVEALQSLHLVGVSWQCLPSLGKMWGLDTLKLYNISPMKEFVIEETFDRLRRLELVSLENFEKWLPSQILIYQAWNIGWFPKLQEFEIHHCPELLLVAHLPWTETLCSVKIRGVKLLEKFEYSKLSYRVELEIFGKDDLQSLDQILEFSNLWGLEKLTLKKCPSLESKHLLMLTSLKTLAVENSDGLVGSLGGEGDVEWQLPIEILMVEELRGASGKELTELLTHLPRLSKLVIRNCTNITQLAMGVDVQQMTLAAAEVEEDRLLVLPAHLCDTLQDLVISLCPELILVEPSTYFPARGFRVMQSLQTLEIQHSPKVLSRFSFSSCIFPSSLQELLLQGMEGMGTLEPLSNLTSLTRLHLWYCGKDLRCKGLGPLLTNGGQLRKLIVYGSPRFFDDPRWMLLQEDGGEEQQLVSPAAICSCKLQEFSTDDAVGFLSAPICSLLSSSLTCLQLYQNFNYKVNHFTNEQEDALHLLASLQQLEFREYSMVQHLPAGLHKLTNLKRLEVILCPEVRSLPKDGLPESLQLLDVSDCDNEDLIQQCSGLVGTIPRIIL